MSNVIMRKKYFEKKMFFTEEISLVIVGKAPVLLIMTTLLNREP